jgi:hypothetical protein
MQKVDLNIFGAHFITLKLSCLPRCSGMSRFRGKRNTVLALPDSSVDVFQRCFLALLVIHTQLLWKKTGKRIYNPVFSRVIVCIGQTFPHKFRIQRGPQQIYTYRDTQRFGNRSSFRNVVFFHCYLGKIRTMDKVRKPNISVCYTPPSEPYSI